MDLGDFKKSFDAALASYLEKRLRGMDVLVEDRRLSLTIRQAKEVALAGGKRARPYMATAMYKSFGGKQSAAMKKVAIGIELFHLFCLVHDDIIDRADTRHGAATVHAFLRNEFGDVPNAERVADSQAMLVGDVLFGWASELLYGMDGFTPARQVVARSIYSKMIDDVIAGQMIDVDCTVQPTVSLERVERKTMLKTATYSFVRPLQLGASLAGAPATALATLETCGTHLGTAFQIQDDLLDVTSSAEKLGKPILHDLCEGQQTYLLAHVMNNASAADKKIVHQHIGKQKISDKDAKEVIAIMERSGAIAAARELVAKHLKDASACIRAAKLPLPVKGEMISLIAYIEHRTT